ncbi:hypothetical protein OS493_019499 [Desmophyllum pertusum]|uniref:Uncharacterized protein n=1 Tax=Desmophyllum pertusum TaxID=174260 RepID=A0A9X0D2I3_9CNID|nr:hypothetical protein OS493_019499 [Desmophyllum pertusum]
MLCAGLSAARIRNDAWKQDIERKETLIKYVKQGFHREEVLDFMKRDFDDYVWRDRVCYFEISFTDRSATVDEVEAAVKPNSPRREGSTIKKEKKRKGHFISKGTDLVHFLDGHDKLMSYQNSTFPLAVYGCIDTCSRKVLWPKVWTSNSDSNIIGRFYLVYLFKNRTIASMQRMDKGTETEVISTMHAFLRQC